jgi:hypothetical protein
MIQLMVSSGLGQDLPLNSIPPCLVQLLAGLTLWDLEWFVMLIWQALRMLALQHFIRA